MDCSPPGSSVHGVSQAKMLESFAVSFSRGSSQPRGRIWLSWIGRQICYRWATWEAHGCSYFYFVSTLSHSSLLDLTVLDRWDEIISFQCKESSDTTSAQALWWLPLQSDWKLDTWLWSRDTLPSAFLSTLCLLPGLLYASRTPL